MGLFKVEQPHFYCFLILAYSLRMFLNFNSQRLALLLYNLFVEYPTSFLKWAPCKPAV